MRVMVIVKASAQSEAGVMPTEQQFRAMGAYAEEMARAGILLVGDGLHPSRKGKRVRIVDGDSQVIDGPFAETKELIGGYWIWQVASMDEAVAWARRYPTLVPGEELVLELRPFVEPEDFGAELTDDLRADIERRRAEVAKRQA